MSRILKLSAFAADSSHDGEQTRRRSFRLTRQMVHAFDLGVEGGHLGSLRS